MGTKRQLSKFAHPALLILVVGALFTFSVGRNPHGGPSPQDMEMDAPGIVLDAPYREESDEAIDMVYVPADTPTQHIERVASAPVPPTNQASQAPAVEPGIMDSVGGPSGAEADAPVASQPEKVKPQIHTHTVRAGETLSDIAKAYNIDIDTIIAANAIPDPNRIRSGDKLSVPNVRGVLHTVRRGESLWNIANYYEVTIQEIVDANEIPNPNTLRVGEQIVVPGAQALEALRQREVLVSPSGQLLRNFSWPSTGRISSRFGPRWGRMHNGLDIAVPTGTPVVAAAAGRVVFSGEMGSYGLLVRIDHGNGIETRYAHNSRLVVRTGQTVARGDLIAYSGNTGNSTGPHVHFEIRRNGAALDPLDFLR